MPLLALLAPWIGLLIAVTFIAIGLRRFSHGLDGSLSLSNLQLILWSGTILGSYLGLAIMNGDFLTEFPSNLLALMGISAGSYISAVGVRAIQETARPDGVAPAKVHRTKGLLSSENKTDQLSLAKFQMLSWTLVSLLIFVVIVANNFAAQRASLPDVGPSLLALMGISHAAYLGNKIADKPSGIP